MKSYFSRRDFLKVAGLSVGALALGPRFSYEPFPKRLPQFPPGDNLGRIAVTPNFYSTELKAKPDANQPALRNVGQDEIIVWQRSVVGTDAFGGTSKTWVETPDG